MTEKIMAVIALIGLFLFLLPLPLFVPHLDLMLFVAVCMLLAGFDFWRELFRKS